MTPRIFPHLVIAILVVILAGCAPPRGNNDDGNGVVYVQPDEQTGTSTAVVVPPAPLALTTNFLPYDGDGTLIGRGDPSAQIARVLENVRQALGTVGADLDDVVKLNVYARSDEVTNIVRNHFASTFTGKTKPAVTFAVGELRDRDADVALDVVAVASDVTETLAHIRVEGIYGKPDRGHVAVLPPRGHVYVSGQVARGDDLIAATRETFEASLTRLSYMGLAAGSIEHVKVFLDDIHNADTVETVLAEYFRDKPAPPIVSLEWVHNGFDIEIEMIASTSTSTSNGEDAITYATPPGMNAVPVYSRIATIHDGDVVYVSGLYGDAADSGEEQIRDIYRQFEDILPQTGTDFNHLAKGQYYVVDWDVVRPLGTVRGEYYEPQTPPTSSLIPVRGVGKSGALISIDLIGVAPPEARRP